MKRELVDVQVHFSFLVGMPLEATLPTHPLPDDFRVECVNSVDSPASLGLPATWTGGEWVETALAHQRRSITSRIALGVM